MEMTDKKAKGSGRSPLLRSGERAERGKGRMGRKICRAFAVLILMAVVAVCIPMTVPRLMGYDVYVVISGSMEPGIPVGSALYVETAEPEDVGAGDVIAFYDNGAVITHRVVENHHHQGGCQRGQRPGPGALRGPDRTDGKVRSVSGKCHGGLLRGKRENLSGLRGSRGGAAVVGGEVTGQG